MKYALSLLLALLASGELPTLAGCAGWRLLAQDDPLGDPLEDVDPGPREVDLQAWGKIKRVKGTDLYSLSYRALEDNRLTTQIAYVKLADDVEFFQDRADKVSSLRINEKLWILGRQRTRSFRGVADRQMQNASVVASGEGLEVNESYRDPSDPETHWLEATLLGTTKGFLVSQLGDVYRVTLTKSPRVVRRTRVKESPALKNGAYVEIAARRTDEKPPAGLKTQGREVFVAMAVVVLDRRLVQTVYPKLLGWSGQEAAAGGGE